MGNDLNTGSASTKSPAPSPDARHPGCRPLAIALRASPALWHRTCERERVAANRHIEFKKSLVWLLQKEGYGVKENAPAPYYTNAGVINGRIDLLVLQDTREVLAIEVDFKATPASGWKLLGKRKDGLQVLLLCGFGHDLSTLRHTVDGWFNKPSISWLALGILASKRVL